MIDSKKRPLMPKIFDAHSHFMPPAVAEKTTFFKVGWSDIDGQLRKMDEGGIARSLLLYPTSDAHVQLGDWRPLCEIYNRDLAAAIKKHPGRFVGAGILPVDSPSVIPSELKRIEELGLRAISLASSYEGTYLDSENFFPVFQFASERNFPVHIHPQIMNPIGEERLKDPLLSPVLEYVFDVSVCIGKMMMAGTFLKYPDVHFIFAHYGGVLPFVKERFDNTYAMLRKRNFVKDLYKNPSDYFKNLYFDMSGSKSFASLLCALELTDAQHILWGSDYPANQNLIEAISVISQSPITDDEKSSIFTGNFSQLFDGK